MSTPGGFNQKGTQPNADLNAPDRTEVIFTDRPDLRFLNLPYVIPMLAAVIGAVIYSQPLDEGIRIAVIIGIACLGLVFTAQLLFYRMKLKMARYTVTTSYVESQTGVVNKAIRRIPLNQINDVTATQNVFQSLAGTNSITVSASNGDSVVLENVTEGQRKQEIIWELVRGESLEE
jgi:uncharacterized membrane protein YdbT with pleckstrin-like domain